MLKIDGQYRGPNALHLDNHPKLGIHRTLIKGALSLAEYLVAHSQVEILELGRCINIRAVNASWNLRCEENKKKGALELVITDGKAVQWLVVRTTNEDSVVIIRNEIESLFGIPSGVRRCGL
ncbi:MAG: hypothetical protein AAB415_01065 [Patescibacteria group bacterium]